jgi:outer membrane protein
MMSKFPQILLAAAVCLAACAAAQTSSAATPAAPSATAPTPTVTTKVATINIERAVVECNEGRREFEALNKKMEPKQNELKGQNDELEALQNKLKTQGPSLNADALASLQRDIDSKKKAFDRAVQDAQEEAGNQQKTIFESILKKMGPVIVKYAQDNSVGMIVDTSNPWPQSPILWRDEGIDITKSIEDAYNAQSGVAAPTSGTAKPAAPKPTTSTPKPAPPKPSTTPK